MTKEDFKYANEKQRDNGWTLDPVDMCSIADEVDGDVSEEVVQDVILAAVRLGYIEVDECVEC